MVPSNVEKPNKPGNIRVAWDDVQQLMVYHLTTTYTKVYISRIVLQQYTVQVQRTSIWFGGDIEKIFHQAMVKEDYQDAQKCL